MNIIDIMDLIDIMYLIDIMDLIDNMDLDFNDASLRLIVGPISVIIMK